MLLDHVPGFAPILKDRDVDFESRVRNALDLLEISNPPLNLGKFFKDPCQVISNLFHVFYMVGGGLCDSLV